MSSPITGVATSITAFIGSALRGTTPGQAYFVRCDNTTTTPADIANGVVNIAVGFAPIEPAEFVVLYIRQMSAQAS